VREHLRQRRTTLYAENLTRTQQGRLPDFTAQDELAETEATLRDIESSHLPPLELLWTIALYGRTEEELEELSRRLEDYLLDANLRFFRASLRQEDGLYSVQPFGVNYLGHGRNITTSALAGMFPFARRLQADATGIPYGIDRTTGAWVIVNDFGLPNSNLLIVGEQGSGKSMFLKYKATWAVLLGMRCYILDLEGEFEPMCRALNGTYLDMALTSPHHMNILDLNPEDPDAWFNGMQDVLAWLEIALGTLTHKERNVILIPAYERIMKEAGIKPDDPTTWRNKPPVLSDLYAVLHADERREAQDLADRLQTLAEGVYASAFSQHTNVNPRSSLVVFGLKNVHADMQALRMRQVHTFIWANVLSKLQPTLVVVDEAWRWLEHPGAAHDLAEMARRFRKRNAGVHLATQHGGDLSASQQAVVIRDTAALTVLFRQTAASVPSVASLFGLNEVEARELLTLDRGESVLLIGPNHIPLYTVIPPDWYPLWTTDPRDKHQT
jgi:type IV secretory pathway VirB4 component